MWVRMKDMNRNVIKQVYMLRFIELKKSFLIQWNNIDSTIRGIVIFGGLLLCFYLLGKYKYRNLDENALYINGRISSTSSRKNGVSYEYDYVYKGKSYEGHYIGSGGDFRKEDFILIKFQSTDPQIHKALFNYKFLSNVDNKEFPLDGWDTLPVKLIFERE